MAASDSDTVCHILNGCMPLKSYDMKRHDRIVNMICSKISSYIISEDAAMLSDTFLKSSIFDNTISSDRTFSTSYNRPDITAFDHSSKIEKIINISTPFDAHIDKFVLLLNLLNAPPRV